MAAADIPHIFAIAQSLRLNRDKPQKSFFNSGYTEADYEGFRRYPKGGDDCVRFMAAKDRSGKCLGFLLAYSQDYVMKKQRTWPERGTEHSILELLAPRRYFLIPHRTRFYVIKQIGIHLDHQHQGIARELYKYFLATIRADYVFSAIVTEPRNEPSEKLHRSFGFVPILQSYSFSNAAIDDSSGSEPLINQIWLRPSFPNLYLYDHDDARKDKSQESDSGDNSSKEKMERELLIQNYHHVGFAYRHEDDLNWKKLGTMIAALLGFMAIAGFIIHELPPDAPNARHLLPGASALAAILVTIVQAFFVLLAFSIALQSGLFFMHSHKQVLRILEARLTLMSKRELFIAALWRLPSQSKSVGYLRLSHFFVFIIWISICALMVLEYLFWRQRF